MTNPILADVSKTCFKCNRTLPLSEFYAHPMMKDGHLGKCKDCAKLDALLHRRGPAGERVRAYDRMRGKKKRRARNGYQTEYRRRNPQKYKAVTAVNNAVRDGRLTKKPCEVCGTEENTHAHHDDYSKPLGVRWLCNLHHLRLHADGYI